MKNRKIAWLLLLLLCLTALLSGTLLILHSDHGCQQTACPICMALTRSFESFLCATAVLAITGLYRDLSRSFGFGSPESRFIPDWTPVRRKVKLLN